MNYLNRYILSLALAGFCLATKAADEPKDSLAITADPPSVAIGDKLSLTLNGYGQAHYEMTHDGEENPNDFQVKRVILIGNAAVGRHLRALVMVDVAAQAANRRLHEYYLQWNFSDAVKVRMGQFKQPFMYENILIPTLLGALNMTEGTRYMAGIAGDPLQGAMVGRDLGVMATGDLLRQPDGHAFLNYSLGLFNGAGMNTRDNNRAKDLIGMLQVYPVKDWMLTTSFILGHGHALTDSPYGDILAGQNYRRLRWSAGSQWKHGPLLLRSELTLGRNRDVRSRAFYAEAWWQVLPKLDLVVNYDYLNRNVDLSHEEQQQYAINTESHNYTAGLQYWLWRQCRVASQYVRQHRCTGPDAWQWVTQVQFAF
ncbi:MAG: hypothetical protein IKX44_03650 [Prevotella sp.]|nr:hypothetical protein [Prevotella sp.]